MSFQAQACCLLLALVFLVATFSKAHQPRAGLLLLSKLSGPKPWHPGALALLIALECELGLRLLLGRLDWLSLGLSLFLLLSFMGLLTHLHRRGFRESCSCYGAWIKLRPLEALKLDVFYGCALVIIIVGQPENLPRLDLQPMGASFLLIVYFAFRLKIQPD
jgi:hypothetical protein